MSLKVLHIGTSDYSGAGIGMLNLHHSLVNIGIDSKVLVADKRTNESTVFMVTENINHSWLERYKYGSYFVKALKKLGLCRNAIEKYYSRMDRIHPANRTFFTLPLSNYDLSTHPLVAEADIIHLHWISNFVDFPSFFKNVNKPIVWTLRDENPGLGGFHYETNKSKYYKYYKDLEDELVQIKRESICQCSNLTLICMSEIMDKFCSHSDFLSTFDRVKIFNLINQSTYQLIDKNIAKSALGIGSDEYVISFVSVYLADERKGLRIIKEALDHIDKRVKLLCVGKNNYSEKLPDNVICFGTVDNGRLLSLIYSASDVFVNPSEQESFGKTIVESLLCGTPVISTKVGIAPEVIEEANGILLDGRDSLSVLNAINRVMEGTYSPVEIRSHVIAKFNSDAIVKEHVDLYKRILTN